MFLLDINVLLALVDPDHPHHQRAEAFFPLALAEGWATCPITENGFLRILGNTKYPNGPGSPTLARPILESICTAPGHQFWQDSISLLNTKLFPNLPSSKDVTDAYLLALAVSRKGRFATLDQKINPAAVVGGAQAYFLVS